MEARCGDTGRWLSLLAMEYIDLGRLGFGCGGITLYTACSGLTTAEQSAYHSSYRYLGIFIFVIIKRRNRMRFRS